MPTATTTPHTITIAVLGLGRMGTALAARLAAQGRRVVGWTRSGRTAGAFETVADPNDAVARADVVLLALFDGPACREVVDRVRDALRTDTVVVNTSTVAPAEAAALAGQLGPRYVHAPVLGSVPTAAAGALKILAAADQDVLARVRPVLEALGTVHRADDAATAAALKLVANSSLAGAVLALRDCLQQADALGLPRDQVLDVLELGQLGGLVARKRGFLDGRGGGDDRGGQPAAPATATATATTATATPTAEFTIGALAKDMTLLAAASNIPLRSAAELTAANAASAPTHVDGGSRVTPDTDIALAAAVPAVDASVLTAVLAPLHAYLRGHATGDPAPFREAFLPTAHIEGIRDGAFVSWPLDEYCRLFPGHPASDEPTRSRRVDSVEVHGTVATATMTLRHGADTFTDVFLLVRVDSGWRIANKAYHRQGS
ncbi:nuclear transport factor 2 family protein [Streptomyces sp. NA04227]|uniref:nuclear transport factor 2 family protein n=1 Tax=Streptomyces sp. NA04227 TaxID=2742136 RepID=UPI0015911FF9|nr:nuclear transport factor 2 family protein [Streptomyces sp. NA04227]QKW10951.1 nuclear transport factor 2 family protein [Streptomyces sp. NA04227]